jgi:glucose/arabinose dehydrogenase
VTGEERFLGDLNERIRDVAQGPDGAIYVVTDSPNGKVLRLGAR